ncbi:MAG: 16S rRNA (adenine(1518)-N(6)/adenine(1519)-N(6))-dimethyltransferase RsmA [Chloroflexota bacterium]
MLARHNLRPRHTLGQNFIARPEPIAAALAAADVGPADTVLEIGPGLGALTQALATRAGAVRAIELDRSLAPALAETVGGCGNVRLVFADAREVDYAATVAPASGERAKAIANLPYYATTPLLERLIWSPACFGRIVVLVQAEAVGRIIASPGEAGYGPLSLLAECFYSGEVVTRVPRDCFWPQPHVDSALLALRRRSDAPPREAAEELFALIGAAFAQRRKTVVAALAGNRGGAGGLPALPRDTVRQALADAGLALTVRAEQLSLAEFLRLLTALRNQVAQQ